MLERALLCVSVSDFRPICIRGEAIERVSAFKYLRAIIEGKGDIKSDVLQELREQLVN